MIASKSPGLCLASQDIRDKISQKTIIPGTEDISRLSTGYFSDVSLEGRIQPSSYEPTIQDHLFILDTDTNGVLRPAPDETVRRALLQIPKRQRQRVDISNGFELKSGFSYLIPLQDRLILTESEHVVSSQKSSRGRLFLNTRMLTDFNPAFNEIDGLYKPNVALESWLLVQPTAFNIIVYPQIIFNQLRFFTSKTDIRLADSQLIEEIEKMPFLYEKSPDGHLVPLAPSQHVVSNGLRLHLDAQGLNTSGIVSLKARKNPNPIDLSKKAEYTPEDYFEPEIAEEGRLSIDEEARLPVSAEYLIVPPHLSAELDRHSDLGLSGSLHDAGFVDNGWKGDLVFELSPNELAKMTLRHGTPLSNLAFFRTTQVPDKIYGAEIGSSYQGQIGPRVSNNFKPFDFKRAAKEYKKLNKKVLVHDASILQELRIAQEGFEFTSEAENKRICEIVESGFFHYRYDCEEDERVLQVVPYILLFGPDRTIFTYVRSEKIQDYGEEKLFGKHSIGVGGHIRESDKPHYIKNCIERELGAEVKITGDASPPRLIGTLFARDAPVDKVHFGLIYALHTNGFVEPKESALISGRMAPILELKADPHLRQKYETWSRILVPSLEAIYALT